MKTYTYTVVLILFCYLSNSGNAQKMIPKNLVPNPSFEHLINLPMEPNRKNYFECEYLSGFIPFQENLAFWKSANRNTPDLRIVGGKNYSCLKRRYKYIVRPHRGKVMIGIITSMSNDSSDTYREYIQLKLRESLKPGIKTFCELWICKDRKAKLACNNMCFYFSQDSIYNNIRENLTVEPQVNHTGIINKDGQKWEKIVGYFYPDKPHAYLTIGNFYDNEHTQTDSSDFHSGHALLVPYASYLIDDVRVWQENDSLELVEEPLFDLTKKEPIQLKNINFETNSDELLASSFVELNKLLKFLKKYPKIKIAIHGHTDSEGRIDFNLDLSDRRAKAVVNFLNEKEIPLNRLEFQGYGEGKPIDTNKTASGRLNNRRVEFVVLEEVYTNVN